MEDRRVNDGPRVVGRGVMPAGFHALIRSRAVQGVLLAAAAVQGIAVAGGGSDADAKPEIKVSATVDEPVGAAFRASPRKTSHEEAFSADENSPDEAGSAETSADAEALAEEYRSRGYDVSDALAAEIVEAAGENGIDPEVAFGLVAVESGFKAYAVSPVGAVGLAQLMPATARLLRPGTTKSDLHDPEVNLRLGFRFLRDLLAKYDGDTELALLAYNRGPGTVDRILQRGGDPDNGYAWRVLGK